MLGKAHVAVGTATALTTCFVSGLITGHNMSEVAICALSAASVASLPDIDNGAMKKAYRLAIVGTPAIFMSMLFTFIVSKGSISGITSSVFGLLGLCIFCIFGRSRPHREFTHSFAAMAIAIICIYIATIGLPTKYHVIVTMATAVSYLSHLVLDLSNKKGEQLLWPVKGRYCLKLCGSNGIANRCCEVFGLAISIIVCLKCIMV